MAFTVTDLSTLDATAVSALQSVLAELVGASYPEIDLSRGVVHDVVLHLASILLTAEESNVEQLRESFSLALIRSSPTTVDPAIVDLVLANFRISRMVGQAALGSILVVLDTAVPVVIPNGAVFSAGSATFITTQSYAIWTDSSQVTNTTDQVLISIGSGQYTFSIPAVCSSVGVTGMLRRGQTLTPGFTIPHLLAAFAAADFSGGVEAETNAELVGRLDQGIAAPCFGNRGNVAALIAAQPAFARLPALSIVGAGDPELIRSARSILPILLPGRCDVYARTAGLPLTIPLSVIATFQGFNQTGGIWQFSLSPGAAPGFYSTVQIATPGLAASLSPADPGFAVLSEVRALSLPSAGWAPDLRAAAAGLTAVDAVYTSYQAATIRFLDDVTPTTGLVSGVSQATYAVVVSFLPGIDVLQNLLSGRSIRPIGGDVLVRAPVPCWLSVGLEVRIQPGSSGPDPAASAAAIATVVNATGFSGTLHSSTVANAISPLLPAGAAVGAVDLFGRIRRPDGSILYLRDPRGISISVPDDPASGVSARTVCFFLDPGDVAVTVRVLTTLEI